EGPMKETNSPLPISRETSESASTGPSSVRNVRLKPLAETTGAAALDASVRAGRVSSVVSAIGVLRDRAWQGGVPKAAYGLGRAEQAGRRLAGWDGARRCFRSRHRSAAA